MTLEDQIRRMGEARATEIDTPTWHGHVGGSRNHWPILLAAAGVVAVLAGLAIVFLAGSDTDTDVVGPAGPVRRWIPASGVERIGYPGDLALFTEVIAWPSVALVVPDGRTDAATEDITLLLGGSSPYRRNTAPADDFRVSTRDDGTVALSLTRGDELDVARIETRRFSASDLEQHATDLLPLSTDLEALAEAVASWDDELSVAYVGEPVPIEAAVSADDSFDDAVYWLATDSTAQFLATNGPGWFADLLALDSTVDYALTEEYFGLAGERPAVAISEAEWLLIVDDVLGRNPRVDFPGSELLTTDPGVSGLATPAAEAVRHDGGGWTVSLRFAEPTVYRDGGAIVVTLGRVTLTFGLVDPGVEFTTLTVPSRMAEAEARRYAELINDHQDDPPQPSVTSSPYRAVGPIQAGICAANPVPSDGVLDVATHIAFDRTPLDLDQDGVDDEILVYDDADGNWFLLARLQTGWTNALGLGGSVLPSLVLSPGGVPAASDLDGDGGLEFFLNRYEIGNATGLTSLQGCELVDTFPSVETPDQTGATFGVVTRPPEAKTCRSGCFVRVACRDNVLVQELVVDYFSAVDANWTWTTTEVRLVRGVIEVGEPTERTGSPLTAPLPADAPGPEDAGVIDCTP